MSCTDSKKFLTSEASTKSWFRTNKIIDKYLNILDLSKFRKETKRLSLIAREKYNLEGWLFNETPDGKKAIPNSHLFHLIDKAKGIRYDANSYLFNNDKNIKNLVDNKKSNIFESKIDLSKNNNAITDNDFETNYKKVSSALFNGEPKNTTAQEVLTNIASSGLVQNKFLNDLLTKLAVQAKSKVKIINNSLLPNIDTYMYFKSEGNENTIYISKEKLGTVSPEIGVAKFLHEVFHERTYRVINRPKSKKEVELVEDLNRVFNYVRTILPGFQHELSDLNEFTAGMFSNPEFESNVKEIINDTFWKRIKQFFSDLFNINLNTDYDRLMSNILELVDSESDFNSNTPLSIKLETKTPDYRNVEADFGVNKLEKTSNKIVKLLETFFNISSRTQSTYNSKIGEILTSLDDLKEKYKDHEDKYATLAVAKYVKFMYNQMKSFERRLESPKLKFNSNLYNQMENYLSAFSLINDINELNDDLKFNGIIDAKTHAKYDKTLKQVISMFNSNKNTLNLMAKNYLIDNFASPEYFKEEYLRFKDFYYDEAKKIYPGKEGKKQRESYVNRKLSENRDMIAERTKDRFRQLIENSKEDISKIASQINSEKSLNNSIIQILSRALDKNELEYKSEIFPKLREMQQEYDTFVKGKRKNTSSDKLFSKFVEVSSSGKSYLKGVYSIKFMDKHQEFKTKEANILEEKGPLSEEYKQAILARKKWFRENTVKLGRRRYVPKDNWKNDLSKLTEKERDYLEHIRSIADEAADNTHGIKSLKKMYYEAEYYQLPSIRKSTLTKIQSGQLVSGLKETIKEAWTRQVDEDEEGDLTVDENLQKVYTDLSGKEINYVPIHYRGNLDPKEQSIDLSTIYAMELENSIKFKHKNTIHSDLDLFIDILRQSDFTKKVGFTNKTVTSLFSKEGIDPVKISGEDANVVKLAETMMKNRMYDKLSAYAGKIGPVDANKAVGQMLGFTSQLGMALNYFGATANFTIGSVNNIIESFAGDVITPTNIKNALKMYSDNVPGLMKDVGETSNSNIVNQIMDRYNIFGDIRNLKQAFEKNNKLKALFKGDSLQFMHNVGEHGMQAVLTLAVLDNIKVLDKKGNIAGDSLLNMYTLDKNGNLDTKNKIEYTSLDTLNKFDEGGENNVRGLIKQMILRNHGNYDSRLQSEFQRHWYGKMIMMYKKHIEVPMLNRTRGLATSLKKREDLTRNELKYNYDLGKIDEGHYTSMVRFIRHNVIPNLKALKLKLIMTDFNSLDEWEKANLKRAMTEASFMGMFASIAQILAAVAGDDDEALWFAAYTFRRMQSDLAQYHNPNEAWRILKNPFASLRQVELVTEIAETVFSPWSWDDEYEGGPYKGESILKRKLIKLTPVLTRKDLTAKQAFSFIDR